LNAGERSEAIYLIGQGFGLCKCFSHNINSFYNNVWTKSVTSSGVGTSPPHLPNQ
jgi:hypothetical protein